MIDLNWDTIGEHLCDCVVAAAQDPQNNLSNIGLQTVDLEGSFSRPVTCVEQNDLISNVTIQFGSFRGQPHPKDKTAFVQEIDWHVFLFMPMDETIKSSIIFLRSLRYLANVFFKGRGSCNILDWTTALGQSTGAWPLECYPEDVNIFDPAKEEASGTKARCLHFGFLNIRTVFEACPLP